jgi:tetratricopeptide (TPR) repeat protein
MILLTVLASLVFGAFGQQSTFDVIGNVRDDGGKPVDGIRVSLVDDNYQTLNTVFTDSSGKFRFPGLVQGRYQLKVEPAGKPFYERSLQLDLQAIRLVRPGNEPYPVDIVIKRKKDAAPERAAVLFAQQVPDTARSEYERGVNSLKENKSDEAIQSLKKALLIFPDYFVALELLGTEYVKRNEFEPAVPILTHALEVNHAASKSLYALGVANLKLNHAAEAIEWLKKCADLDSSNANAYMYLGIAYGNNRELDQAESALKKAYQLGGTQAADAHLYLAGLYNKQERYAEAVKELELYLREATNVKNSAPIRETINKLKEKAKTKKS